VGLGLLLDLEVDRLGVPLDLFDPLDDLVFKDLLTIFDFGNTFCHVSFLGRSHVAMPSH
jgi:hypothetical protein